MKIRPLLIVASVVALSACNSNKGANNSVAANTTATTNATAPATPNAPAATGGTADAQLQQEIAMAVQMLRPQLPIRQQTPQGELVISNIEARGAELVYTMQLPMDMDQAMFQQFESQLPVQACQTPQARMLLERGGTYTYLLKDSGGEEFTTSVSSCPAQ